jgi:hypothetical protein
MDKQVFLRKNAVSYMGGSGPGTARYLTFPEEQVEIDERLQLVADRFSANYRIPQGTQITLSNEANRAFEEYLAAYKEFQEAKKRYDVIKEQFGKTDGGKEIKKLLHPDEESLPIESVIKDDDIKILSNIIEARFDCKTDVYSTEVIGYNGAHITLKCDKDIELNAIQALDFNNYIFDSYNMEFTYADKIRMLKKIGFISKKYNQYPPFRYEDYKEVTEINRQRIEQYDK